jgi:ABC-type uncharacterized transport system substrate-binding protein
MNRRAFISALGGAAASSCLWPLAARAQQQPRIIGYLDTSSREARRATVAGILRGLSETGYVEGRNLDVVYAWAEEHLERLSSLADDLVRRRVGAIIAVPDQSAVAAKAATKSIPVVFLLAANPVEARLVSSLNRPDGNATGVVSLSIEMAVKRLEVMHELVPAATSMAYLVNPSNPIVTENETREMQVAARTIGIHLRIVHAKDPTEFNVAIETAVREGAGGLVVGSDVLFLSHPEELATLAARHRLPSVYRDRRAAVVGGLLSYGTDLIEARRQVGVYVGRILNGEKTADLPVQQVTKTQFVINIKAAKMLGIEISPTLLIRADEVIE